MIDLSRLTSWINKRSGELVVAGIAAILIGVANYLPYLNLVVMWFGLTAFTLIIIYIFKWSNKAILILSSAILLAGSLFIYIELDYIAEQLALLAFNLAGFSAIRLLYDNMRGRS